MRVTEVLLHRFCLLLWTLVKFNPKIKFTQVSGKKKKKTQQNHYASLEICLLESNAPKICLNKIWNEIQGHFNWCQRAIFFSQMMLRNAFSSSEEHRDLLRAIDKEMRVLRDHYFITEFRFTCALHHLVKTEREKLLWFADKSFGKTKNTSWLFWMFFSDL